MVSEIPTLSSARLVSLLLADLISQAPSCDQVDGVRCRTPLLPSPGTQVTKASTTSALQSLQSLLHLFCYCQHCGFAAWPDSRRSLVSTSIIVSLAPGPLA